MCRSISMHCEIELTIDAFPELENDKRVVFDEEGLIYIDSTAFPLTDVISRQQDRMVLSEMSWGVVPLFEKDRDKIVSRRLDMVNARAERILDENSFWYKSGLVRQPVLIPVTSIFEYRHIHGWSNKVPYAVRTNHQPELHPFYVPGMYQLHHEHDAKGQLVQVGSFTMVTTEANEVMRQIHNGGNNPHRMPLFLPLDMGKQWISASRTKGDVKEILQYRLPPDQLSYHTVFTLSGKKSRPDGKAKDAYWEWPNLPELGNDYPKGSATQTSLF
ncbi:SOS response-associated peptidase [Chitinophaga pinensis]|uniref:Abasic site processing protein n=1 Tax=Chitinophaga pinensis TaxID=79329 RepID=A0A5C6LNP3_9BACT|nr:SOS response-associated peptidase family protein [Chitinophaga pinensis]TWV91982.1 SOS response-associated peptidase [Chitinophaga pinensis]